MAATSTPISAGPPAPPAPANTDELLASLAESPLFMTELDPETAATNPQLEALRALAYEGTKAEVAENFRQQGNDCAKSKRWGDAREFYDKALAVLSGSIKGEVGEIDLGVGLNGGSGPKDVDVEEEGKKEKLIEEACFVNRALCNLELKNFGSCNRDCAQALRLNARNIKAYYRVGLACLALDKLAAAQDACKRALILDPENAAASALLDKIEKRSAQVAELEMKRRERQKRAQLERLTLANALKSRDINVRLTRDVPVDVEDAKIQLADPVDPSSSLSIPVLMLYPLHAQTEMIKAVNEDDNLSQHFEYIFPLPWDTSKEYTAASIECYMDTNQNGLLKVGKNVVLRKVLSGDNVEIVDGLCRIYVVPKAKSSAWVAEMKRRKA